MRRIALVVAVIGCLFTAAWFVAQPGVEPASAAVLTQTAQPPAGAVPEALPAAVVQQAALLEQPERVMLGAAPAASFQPIAEAKPATVERQDQLVETLRTATGRGDGGCPGATEALAEITRAIAGWDVATASLALSQIEHDNQACAGVAEALARARDAAQHSAGFSTRSAAGFSLRQADTGAGGDDEGNGGNEGGVPGGDGGPGYQS